MKKKKLHKSYQVFQLGLEATPVYTIVAVSLPIIQSVMQTIITALATANFVDTATAIMKDTRPYKDIYSALAFVLVTLGIVNTIGALAKLTNSKVSIEIQRSLNPVIVRNIATFDYKHIENEKSWELISRVSRNPEKQIMDGMNAYIQFAQIIVSIISVFILIVTQVWWAAIVIFLFSVPMFWLSMRAGKKNYRVEREAEKFNRRTKYLEEVLSGRDNVDERTLFGFSESVNGVWQEQYEAGRKMQIKVKAKNILLAKGSSLLLAMISLLIALTLIGPVVNGQMTAGMFMGIVNAVFGMIQKLGFQMSRSLENISHTGEYMKDMGEFMELSINENVLEKPDVEPIQVDTLEFKNVRFHYPRSNEYILDGLTFKLEAGHHYAFVGRNGAGKTTITKLMTGLYTEYDGEILVNGKELRDYSESAIKAMFSVVYQDFAKYDIEMKDNIALGDVHFTDKVEEAANLAGLDGTIRKLKLGISSPLGKSLEGGQDISGGEWQKVAIARTLVSRAPFRILDEPTSALDPISESNLYREFEKMMLGKTTVFISHRLGSTKLANEILVIDQGKIIERGTHEELMEKNGQYAEMFESQREWYQ